jgi:hypothetical protein
VAIVAAFASAARELLHEKAGSNERGNDPQQDPTDDKRVKEAIPERTQQFVKHATAPFVG